MMNHETVFSEYVLLGVGIVFCMACLYFLVKISKIMPFRLSLYWGATLVLRVVYRACHAFCPIWLTNVVYIVGWIIILAAVVDCHKAVMSYMHSKHVS